MGTLFLRLLLWTGPPFYVVIRATRGCSHLQGKGSTLVPSRVSNLRPPALQSSALPTELILSQLVAVVGNFRIQGHFQRPTQKASRLYTLQDIFKIKRTTKLFKFKSNPVCDSAPSPKVYSLSVLLIFFCDTCF